MRCKEVRRVRWADEEEPQEKSSTSSTSSDARGDLKQLPQLRSCIGKPLAERGYSPKHYEPRQPKKTAPVQPTFDSTLETVFEEEDSENNENIAAGSR